MRRIVLMAIALVMALAAVPLHPAEVQAATPPFGELPSQVYFEQTGHHVGGGFLNYWWWNGGVDIFGFPITGEMDINGLRVQYFERARFEWHPENPDHFQVLLGLLGNEVTAGRTEDAFTPYPADMENTNPADHRFFPQTGHFLSYGFKTYWENNGGQDIFGYPISEEFTDPETGYTVQFFQRARFEYHPEHAGTKYEVQLGLLGSRVASELGLDRSRVPQNADTPVWPNGLQSPARWIEVNLSTPQRLIAWEHDTKVFETYISGGTWDHPTPVGTFQIFWKLRYDDMTGGRAGTSEYYYLPDVPYVMYFAAGGYAMHGTYWHANFGYPMSHGCVNLSQSAAAWVYEWAPYGTRMWIHY